MKKNYKLKKKLKKARFDYERKYSALMCAAYELGLIIYATFTFKNIRKDYFYVSPIYDRDQIIVKGDLNTIEQYLNRLWKLKSFL
jgi:hypothetical protein